jgi:hypothetical protein
VSGRFSLTKFKLKDRVGRCSLTCWVVCMICEYELRHMFYRGSAIVPTSTLIPLFEVLYFYKVGPSLGIVFSEVLGVPQVR